MRFQWRKMKDDVSTRAPTSDSLHILTEYILHMSVTCLGDEDVTPSTKSTSKILGWGMRRRRNSPPSTGACTRSRRLSLTAESSTNPELVNGNRAAISAARRNRISVRFQAQWVQRESVQQGQFPQQPSAGSSSASAFASVISMGITSSPPFPVFSR